MCCPCTCYFPSQSLEIMAMSMGLEGVGIFLTHPHYSEASERHAACWACHGTGLSIHPGPKLAVGGVVVEGCGEVWVWRGGWHEAQNLEVGWQWCVIISVPIASRVPQFSANQRQEQVGDPFCLQTKHGDPLFSITIKARDSGGAPITLS